jgi:CspA family cold shock protein
MPSGTVKWFNPDKGYGYIRPDDSDRAVIVRIAEVELAGWSRLSENQRIGYDLQPGYGTVEAVRLKSLSH